MLTDDLYMLRDSDLGNLVKYKLTSEYAKIHKGLTMQILTYLNVNSINVNRVNSQSDNNHLLLHSSVAISYLIETLELISFSIK